MPSSEKIVSISMLPVKKAEINCSREKMKLVKESIKGLGFTIVEES